MLYKIKGKAIARTHSRTRKRKGDIGYGSEAAYRQTHDNFLVSYINMVDIRLKDEWRYY
jgi:hypothetical protein